MRVQEHDRAVAEEDLDWLLENLPRHRLSPSRNIPQSAR